MANAGGLPPPGMGLAGGAQLTQAQWNRATMLKNNLMAAIQSVTGTLSNQFRLEELGVCRCDRMI